jgi:hypothetical protein
VRFFGRCLLGLLLILVLFWAGQGLWDQTLSWLRQGAIPTAAEREVTVSTVYLVEDAWLTFPLPAGSHRLKLLSNASLSAAAAPAEEWPYALEYRVLGEDGAELSRGLYHHRSAQVFSRQPAGEEMVPAAYYLEGDRQPAEGRVLLLNLEGLAEPAQLQVRLAQGAPAVAGVALRLYHLEQEADHKLGFLWQRLSQGQRQSLARGSVYPPELLSAAEKLNLVREGWRPIGPQGVAGRDYFSRQLYLLAGETGEAFEPPVLPAGLLISASNCGTLLLPPAGGRVRLEFLPALAEQQQPAAGAALGLTWYGPEPGQRRSYPLAWELGGTSFSATFPAGLLEFSAPGAVVVRAYLVADGTETEITPPPLYLRGYLTAPGQELLYPVDHAAAAATPMRLDFRTFVTGSEGGLTLPQQGQLEFSWLDAAGEVIRSGSLPLSSLASRYDRLADGGLEQLLAEPNSFYFELPAAVSRVRLVASVPVLASVYTRPADLLRELRVPEKELVAGAEAERQPAWFGLRPQNHESLLEAGRSLLLMLQQRPPTEVRPEVQAGHYLWEDFHPEGSWRGRYLLIPRQPQSPQRLEALAATYRPLPPTGEALLNLVSPLGQPSVAPELLWLRPSAAPAKLGLFVDGALFWSGELAGARGELSLPPLPSGRHRLRLEGQGDGDFYLSHADGGDKAWLKRLANRFDRKGLSFVVEKQQQREVLSARLYVPRTQRQASRVRVTIEGPSRIASGPLREWSFLARRYELEPEPAAAVAVLHTSEEVDGGRAFFIPLGSDLPAGRYRLRMELDQGPGGYLILARLSPGTSSQRFHYRESAWLQEVKDD